MNIAYQLGKEAFKMEKTRVPYHDKALRELLDKDGWDNNTASYCEQWLKGWDGSNKESRVQNLDKYATLIEELKVGKVKEVFRPGQDDHYLVECENYQFVMWTKEFLHIQEEEIPWDEFCEYGIMWIESGQTSGTFYDDFDVEFYWEIKEK